MYRANSPNASYNGPSFGSSLGGKRLANAPGSSPILSQRKLGPELRSPPPLSERLEIHQTGMTKTSWLETARESTTNFKLHGSPLPLVWVRTYSGTFPRRRSCTHKVLVEDNVIPPNAVPFGEDKNGYVLYIARALLEVRICLSPSSLN